MSEFRNKMIKRWGTYEKYKEQKNAKARAKRASMRIKKLDYLADIKKKFNVNSELMGRVILDKTRNMYFMNIKNIYKHMFNKQWMGSLEFLRDTVNVIKTINKNWKLEKTNLNILTSVLSVLARFPEFENEHLIYGKLHFNKKTKGDVEYQENKLSPADKVAMVPWSRIKKTRVQTLNLPLQEKILFRLMVELPRRSSTYAVLRYRTSENLDENYLIFRGSDLWVVLNIYKSSALKGIGPVEYKLSVLLNKMVNRFIRKNKMINGELFFPNSKGGIVDLGKFSGYIGDISARAFGQVERFGSRLWRISRAVHVMSTKKSINKQTEEAHRLGHSLASLLRYDKHL